MADSNVLSELSRHSDLASNKKHDLLITLIEPSNNWLRLPLNDLWHYRDLLYFLTWRDVKVRYKQTTLGVGWALLQPLLTMLVFSLFFGRLAKVPSDGVPYPLFALTALVPWTFFATALAQSSNSLVGNSRLISKVYFPRLIVPLAAVLTGLIDLSIGLILSIVFAFCFHVTPNGHIAFLPLFIALSLITALALGLWLSALNVEYRDVFYVLPFLTQLWMFATPIAYSSHLLKAPWRTFYGLNPMVGVVEGFRWALLGTPAPSGFMLFTSFCSAITVLILGAIYFRRMEKRFADVL